MKLTDEPVASGRPRKHRRAENPERKQPAEQEWGPSGLLEDTGGPEGLSSLRPEPADQPNQ